MELITEDKTTETSEEVPQHEEGFSRELLDDYYDLTYRT